MFRSIRATMLAWQALILGVVLAGFGTALYLRIRASIYEEVDAELLSTARVLSERSTKGKGNPPVKPLAKGKGKEHVYYIVWDKKGNVVQAHGVDEDRPPPGEPPKGEKKGLPWRPRDAGGHRELSLNAPGGNLVLVGMPVARENDRLQAWLGWIVATGLTIAVVGLAGSWLISSRTLRPIRTMTATAGTISASNLAQRLDVAGTKSELADLASVLNDTFARLEGAFARQTQFTADASHELRTPVAIVLSQAEMALARERSPEEYRDALEACHRAAERMGALVSGLLTLARADAGALELQRSTFDLAGTVRRVAELLAPLAQQKQLDVKLVLAPTEVCADADRLATLVSNLLTNAIRYNRAGGTITVSLSRQDSTVVLAVADTGIGIPDEQRAQVFERFHRVDAARAREEGGCGLGLAICLEIVRAHGGTIAVESTPQVGSTFTVKLPADRVA